MDAAVIELDPLADPVGAPADDDHLPFCRRTGFVLRLIGGVVVRGVGLEFRRAGVDELVDGDDPGIVTAATDLLLREVPEIAEGAVGEAEPLCLEKQLRRGRCISQLLLCLNQGLDLVEKPGVDLGQAPDLRQRHPVAEGRGDVKQAERIRYGELLLQEFGGTDIRRQIDHQAEPLDLQGTDRLLEGLPEGPADRHRLADRFHGGGQEVLRLGELFEGPAGDLHDAVVDRRLEGGHRLPGDVVGDLIEGVTHGEFGGDLGDGKTRRLRGERRGAGDAGVHLDDDHLARVRVDGELDVGAARFDADLAHDGDRRVPHPLVLDVGERLGGGDGDRLARMDPHGIHVLDGTDDDHVVRLVAHHLQLVLLPAQGRLFEHDLVDHGGVEPALGDLGQLLPVIGDAAPRSTQGEGGTDDDGKSDPGGDGKDVVQRTGEAALGDAEPDLFHGRPEELAILRLVDDWQRRPDHLDAVFFKDARLRHGDRGVEPRLAAQRGEQRIGALLGDDLFHRFRRDRLDIGPVGRFGVGHDRRRVGVDEDHLVPLLLERLAGLGPGVVELAGLADDDRPGADDQDFLNVRSFRHPISASFFLSYTCHPNPSHVFAGAVDIFRPCASSFRCRKTNSRPAGAQTCFPSTASLRWQGAPENLQCAPLEDMFRIPVALILFFLSLSSAQGSAGGTICRDLEIFSGPLCAQRSVRRENCLSASARVFSRQRSEQLQGRKKILSGLGSYLQTLLPLTPTRSCSAASS